MKSDDDMRQPSGWDLSGREGYQPRPSVASGVVKPPTTGHDEQLASYEKERKKDLEEKRFERARESCRAWDQQSYRIKDSGERREWATGAQRDIKEGKPRFDLIPIKPLTRVAHHYANGAKKYREFNWMKGIPSSDFYDSALRHFMAYGNGERDEDHLAALVFNVFGLMFNQDQRPDMVDWKMKVIAGADPRDVEPKEDDGLSAIDCTEE